MRRSSAADGNGRWKKNAQAFSSPAPSALGAGQQLVVVDADGVAGAQVLAGDIGKPAVQLPVGAVVFRREMRLLRLVVEHRPQAVVVIALIVAAKTSIDSGKVT